VAVFPDRIVLKNSTDNQAAIEAAIGTGGTDAITQGEIVLGIEPLQVKFYTKAGDGSIVSLGGTGVGAQYLDDLLDVDLSTPATEGQVIAYNSTTNNWEPVDIVHTPPGLYNIVEDVSPQLGGALDVNGYFISSASGGNIVISPSTTGSFIVRGNDTDGSITLNCTSNSHGVTIQSPPHADAATYTLILPSDVGTAGQVLTSQGGAQLTWEDAGSGGGGATSIDDLTDVDTSTTPPAVDQVLVWNGTNWVPGDQTGGSGGGGGGSIAGTVLQKSETQTAASGAATFAELGASGILVDITSSLDAWIVLYPTAADRAADAGRAYGTDPAPGSGVLAEFYVTAGGTVLASPGTTYFNNDTPDADALYVAVRDQAGADVNSEVTIKAYVHQNFGGTGTNRVTDSGTASSGTLTLTGMGQTGQFCTVTSSLDAWVAFYGSEADRTADNARTFGTDPAPGSGVQAEFYIAAGTTVLATPGAMYFNNDTDPTDAMYLAVRNQVGASVDSLITVKVYAETSYAAISGGTFGSG